MNPCTQIEIAESDQVRAVYEAWERDFKSSSNIPSTVICSKHHSPISLVADEEDELEQIDLEHNFEQNDIEDILCRGNKLKVMETHLTNFTHGNGLSIYFVSHTGGQLLCRRGKR